jgi:hypothetical protein
MAHVVDALWIARNRRKLELHAGPCQVGGISDAQSLILALVLLAQLRFYQGVATYLALLDLKWAFDVAVLWCMKLACAQAGIEGTDWLLIDDVLDVDTQCVHLHGLLSRLFTLGCGTAQGRRFSVHIFNGMLRWLYDEVERIIPGGTKALFQPAVARCLVNASPFSRLFTSMLAHHRLFP